MLTEAEQRFSKKIRDLESELESKEYDSKKALTEQTQQSEESLASLKNYYE